MKLKKAVYSVLATGALVSLLNGCTTTNKVDSNSKKESELTTLEQSDFDTATSKAEETTEETIKETIIYEDTSEDSLLENDIIASFSPVDCGIQAQDIFEYPFIGMTLTLTEDIRTRMDSRDIFVMSLEDYDADLNISYALLRFSSVDEVTKSEQVSSFDLYAWEAALDKAGAIGVYKKEMTDKLDELTACDVHTKLGESEDGLYEYYISTYSKADADIVKELEKSNIVISKMHELDMNLGYTAFSTDRIDGIENVGDFTMQDIFGETYTKDMFKEYDLTLVNIFATWCSPCVKEMPELEELRKEFEEEGIRIGIAAVVLDAKTQVGELDEGAVEKAKVLYEKVNANFPFLIPDETELNGRLTGIASVPESFFVDSQGNIVSEPYHGANTKEGWKKAAQYELKKLMGE